MASANDQYLQQIENNMNLLKNFKLPDSLAKTTQTGSRLTSAGKIIEDISNLHEINNVAKYLGLEAIDLKSYIEKAINIHDFPFIKLVLLIVELREEVELKKGECQKKIRELYETALGIV